MTKRLRVVGFGALLLTVAALAYGPLASANFVGEDLPFLVRASGLRGGDPGTVGAAELASRLAEGDGPLAHASLRLSYELWARSGTWGQGSALFLRLENLLLLLGAAAFARLALRRTLAPWTGMDSARAAAGACAVLVACHPVAVAAIASASARGDLLAIFFAGAAAALFLRGRQEKEPPTMIAAAVCALAAGHASTAAMLLPALLAALELFSARRGRPTSVRLRTTATTLVVFGALVGVEALTGPALGSTALPLRALASAGELFAGGGGRTSLSDAVRDLGGIALPVPRGMLGSDSGSGVGLGAVAYVIAGGTLLAALQPALVAARSAPRLWGWLAASTAAGLLLPLVFRAAEARDMERPVSAVGLLPAALVACAGLAVASTSLSGVRRVLVPALLAASFIVFARASASPWIEASRPLAALRADVAALRAAHGGSARILVVDPPGSVAGLEVAGSSLPLLLHPSLCGAAETSDSGSGASIRGISAEALFALVRQPEFDAMRRTKLVLLLPPASLGDPDAKRTALAVLPPRSTSGTLSWREELRSPLFDIDPLERRALRAVAMPTASTADAPRMGWRAGESSTRSRSGVWIEGRDAPSAVFDLSRDADWLFGERVHRAWLEPEIGRIASAELLQEVPSLVGRIEPEEQRDGNWFFRLDPSALPRPVHGEARLALGLLDLDSLRYVEIPAMTQFEGEQTVFPIPSDFRVGDLSLAWSLELRVGNTCIARRSGRR